MLNNVKHLGSAQDPSEDDEIVRLRLQNDTESARDFDVA
jgi:hypothetical protein